MERPTLIIANRNYSSWSLRAWLAMEATGQEFDEVVIPLGQPDTAENILRWSPTARVPALKDGDVVLWDSLAICEHLAEAFPEAGLWPTDARARATARSVVAEMHSGFVALRKHMPMNLRASYPDRQTTTGCRGRHRPDHRRSGRSAVRSSVQTATFSSDSSPSPTPSTRRS